MSTEAEAVRKSALRFCQGLFRAEQRCAPNDPIHCDVPTLRGAEVAALYYDQRRAGDFYEFLRVARSRLLSALLDMAGRRADTRDILRAAQKTFREAAAHGFASEDLNETTAMVELCNAMNRTILRGGIRTCAGFIACYNEDLGTICYANAGHTPALVRDVAGVTLLEATGLPWGCFPTSRRALPLAFCRRRAPCWSSRVALPRQNTKEKSLDWQEPPRVFRTRGDLACMMCAPPCCRRPKRLRAILSLTTT
jgi:hypothetical protein